MTYQCEVCSEYREETDDPPTVWWHGFNGTRTEMIVCARCDEEWAEAEMEASSGCDE